MFANCCVVLFVFCISTTLALAGENAVEQSRHTLAKWVETRQLITRTRADWESDREILQQSIKVLEEELSEVNEQFSKADGGSEHVGKERAELLSAKESFKEGNDRMNELLPAYEKRALDLSRSFPSPLLARIGPLMARVPRDSAETKMSPLERMQTIVGILNEVDKFNGTITVNSEIQKNAKGENVQVKVLYLGLGQAYWIDKAGRVGTSIPGPEGWKWQENAALADRIAKAVSIYESSQPAAFVSLPVTIK